MEDMEKSGSYTLFVPVDKALEMNQTPMETLSARKLKSFLKAHIVKGKIFSKELMKQETLKTLNGKTLKIDAKDGKLKINESRVLFKDTEAQNGVIHFIYPSISF